MSVVKMHCVLGLNSFFHSEIYNKKCTYLTSETQPLRNLRVGRDGLWSTFSNKKMKKWRRLLTPLCNLPRCGAFFATFTSEKRQMTIKESLFLNWQLMLNFFIVHLPILVWCKNQRRSRSDVCLTGQLAIRCLIAKNRTRWCCNTLKGSHRRGDERIFSKKPPCLSL